MQRVLFVCVHNSGRSKMAEAFFNQLADERLMRAESAGTQPGSGVNPAVVAAMQDVGIDLSNSLPQQLTPALWQNADRVITMGCMNAAACPAGFLATEDWGLEDPHGQPLEKVRAIRDQIRARVQALIADLAANERE